MKHVHNKGKVALSDDVVAARRLIVRTLRNRGLTQYEIANMMATKELMRNGEIVANEYYLINPLTKEPFDRSTISRDLVAVRDEYRKLALQQHQEWVSDQLAQLDEVKREAWKRGDLQAVLKSLKQESELLGLDAPTKTEIAGKDGGKVGISLTVDDMSELFRSMGDYERSVQQ